MKILHIIKNPDERKAFEIAKIQAKKNEIGILLIQDGVLGNLSFDFAKTYISDADVKARNLKVEGTIDYDEMIKLIFEYDRVISW